MFLLLSQLVQRVQRRRLPADGQYLSRYQSKTTISQGIGTGTCNIIAETDLTAHFDENFSRPTRYHPGTRVILPLSHRTNPRSRDAGMMVQPCVSASFPFSPQPCPYSLHSKHVLPQDSIWHY